MQISANLKYELFKKLCNNKNIEIISTFKIDKNAIYYFLKLMNPEIIEYVKTLKKHNNILIYEPLDFRWKDYKNINEYINNISHILKLFNIIICNNKYIKSLYEKHNNNLKFNTMYHEYDIKLFNNNILTSNIYYVGSLNKSSLTENDIDKYNIIKSLPIEDKMFAHSSYNGIHIDYVMPNKPYYSLHTSTKLSTALYYDSIFICNMIPVYVELLGNSYELYFKDDLSNLFDVIQKAKIIILDTVKYNNYINKMKQVKNKLSPEHILNCYSKIFLNN
jgi:hypothetical protein